jgi:uncharacterized membrane protein YdjX (TVP38/TMEM64 family)
MNKKTILRILLALVLLGMVALAYSRRDQLNLAALQTWIDGAGIAAPLVFIAIYAAATVLFLPGSVLTLAGGALFGPVWGTLYNVIGATLGASLSFLVARYLGGDWITNRAGPRLTSINDGVSKEGWRFIAFVRLVPLFPFNLLNYMMGLTRIPFLTYVLASAAFILPGTLAYTWLGYAGREALGGGESVVRTVLIALALVATMSMLPRWIRMARAKSKANALPEVETSNKDT